MNDFLTGKWYGTKKNYENLFQEVVYYAIKTKTPFDIGKVFWDFYEVQK